MEADKLKTLMRHGWKYAGGIAGLVVIVVWSSGLLRVRQAPGKLAPETGSPLPAGSLLHRVSTQDLPARLSLPGTVRSERRINLSARLPAYVQNVHVTAGAVVREGDLLIELDQRELLKDLAAAEAQLQLAETGYQRAKRLLGTNATTAQAFEAAESAYKSAEAGMERIKVMLTYTRITAPLDGVVTDRYVEAGDLASPGQVLLSVYDPASLRLEVPVPARLISRLPVGKEVIVKLDQVQKTVAGKVVEIVSEFDPVTRTRRVKVHLEGVAGDVLPGMYGQVMIDAAPQRAVLVPEGALMRIGQLESVQVVRDGRLYRRLVRAGSREAGQVEILSGLQDGEQVLLAVAENDPRM